jgi:TetR/AcrR family transcriptional regulator
MVDSANNIDGRSKKRPGVDEQSVIITKAAVSLFAEKGVRAVSIAQICNQAEVSRPTFYRCFEDKDALVSRIYEESVNAYVENFLASSHLQDNKQLKTRLDELLESIFQHAELAQLVFLESSDPGSPAARIIDTAFEHAADVMTGSSARSNHNNPSRIVLKSIMAAVQWIVQDAIRKGSSPAARKDAKSAAYTLVSKTLS